MNAPPQSAVVNTSEANFKRDVFERSHTTPVVVDFWAEWCAPCRMLAPVLEELANESNGRFVLVKANTDELPEAATEFQVQGIPAVYAVIGGEVVDFFTGALPKSQIQAWLDRVLGHADLISVKNLETTDPAAAETKYRDLMAKLPQDSTPAIGLARVLTAQNRDADALAVIEKLEKRGFLEPEAEKVKAALELRKNASADISQLQKQAAANPQDFELQLRYAEALAAKGDYEAALAGFLLLVQRDRQKTGEKARQFMVDIFRVLPNDSELTRTFRRQLSSALY